MDLYKLALDKLKTLETYQGVAWSATLIYEGRVIGTVDQAGEGGPNRYRRSEEMSVEEFRQTIGLLEDAARGATGLPYEALDAVTASMGKGDRGTDGVKAFKMYRACT